MELLASIWAFGLRFFKSWFHCLDATVITVGFVIDVLLKGILEEIGSLVVVLRLWRVFKVRRMPLIPLQETKSLLNTVSKIIEELSAGAEEQMEPLHERVEDLELENKELRREIDELKMSNASAPA